MIKNSLNKIISLLVLLSACQCLDKKPEQTVLFATRLEGYVEPCGCTEDPLGGISRLATLVKQYPKATFVHVGNLLFDPKQEQACVDQDKISLLLSTLKHLGLSGTLSDSTAHAQFLMQDQVSLLGHNGVAYLKLGSRVKVALVELSQLDNFQPEDGTEAIIWGRAPGEVPMSPFRLLETGPYVFSAGFQGQYLGVLEFFNLEEPGSIQLDTRTQDRERQRELIQKRLDALRAKTSNDFVASRIRLAEAELAKLDLEQDPKISGPYVSFKAIAINRGIQSDPEIAQQLEIYNQKLPERLAACEKNIDCPSLKPDTAVYVGAETCKKCHEAAYMFWKKALVQVRAKTETGQMIESLSGHSKAWKTLEEKNKTLDRNCIACHSVGFMKPGGYCKAQEVDFRVNVQCESCHGPGSLHAQTGNKAFIQRKVPENQCRQCHHVPHIPTEESFVYHEKLKVILGPGHGESLLLKLNK